VYYRDDAGNEWQERCAATPDAWAALTATAIQCVKVLYDYQRRDGTHLQAVLVGQDHYWWHPDTSWAAGAAVHVPVDTNPLHLKDGLLVDRESFYRIYNAACVHVPWGSEG
jgi:hypothetical protein